MVAGLPRAADSTPGLTVELRIDRLPDVNCSVTTIGKKKIMEIKIICLILDITKITKHVILVFPFGLKLSSNTLVFKVCVCVCGEGCSFSHDSVFAKQVAVTCARQCTCAETPNIGLILACSYVTSMPFRHFHSLLL